MSKKWTRGKSWTNGNYVYRYVYRNGKLYGNERKKKGTKKFTHYLPVDDPSDWREYKKKSYKNTVPYRKRQQTKDFRSGKTRKERRSQTTGWYKTRKSTYNKGKNFGRPKTIIGLPSERGRGKNKVVYPNKWRYRVYYANKYYR